MENRSDISKNFVPYELAVKLKELGFDDRSLGFSYMEFNCEGVSNATFEKAVPNYLYNSYDLICTAPLYQQVFDWFREKYDLHSEIRSYTSGKFTFVIQKIEVTVKYLHYGGINFVYSSYEEARLKCLEKLIELCKKIT